jgi:peptide/nickel transport system substrate-binding protein
MKTKVFVLLLAFMLVAALAFGGGKKEVAPAAEVTGEPRYGGTLTAFRSPGQQNADSPTPSRMASATSAPHFWRQPFQEMPLVGDFEKFGPRGTGQFAFQVRGYIPEQYMRGQLLESWEVTPDKIIWRVRKGIYWHGNKPHLMKSRELVADDLTQWVEYRRKDPAGSYIRKAINSPRTIDKYTLEIPFAKGYDFMVMYLIGYEDRCEVEPPETVAAGDGQWENQVGTGPFMNTEYVVGSYFRYERNPNYYEKTTIDGKEYQLPFVDEMIYPIMPDEATQIAALRTGKLDWYAQVPAPQWSVLDSQTPDLKSARVVAANGFVLAPRLDKPPFDNIKVRHALMIGTDMNAFNAILGSGIDLPIDWHPLYPGDPTTYVPMEKLPAESRALYEYNPTKAKQMLREAGVPEGFRMEVVTQSYPMAQERASLLAAQWAKIGITVDVKVCDETTYVGFRYDKNFKDALMTVVETPSPIFLLQRTGYTDATLNPAHYSDPEMDGMIDKIVATLDLDERNRLAREAGLKLLYDCPYIPLQCTAEAYFWWPWIKNYYGEFNVQDAGQPVPLFAHMWIDQDLKAKMGFK